MNEFVKNALMLIVPDFLQKTQTHKIAFVIAYEVVKRKCLKCCGV